MPVFRMTHITRLTLQLNPHSLFLFGDNLARCGMGGQAAEMRGEPNAHGIPTKIRPGTQPEDYFHDAHEGRIYIDHAFDLPVRFICEGRVVVVPAAGLGTGLAQLRFRAPDTFNYLQYRLKYLDDLSHEISQRLTQSRRA